MIKTWYEVYWDYWLDVDLSIQKIQEILTIRRPEKYSNFLNSLENLKKLFTIWGLPDIEKRVKLFKYVYYAMRLLDDICDWDTPFELSAKEKIYLSKNTCDFDWKNLINLLLKEIYIISDELWIIWEVAEKLELIIKSVKFDLYRSLQSQNWIVSKSNLENNFYQMDINWTIWLTAILFCLDENHTTHLLKELWKASRLWFNLEDFSADISKKLSNISKEEMESYWISVNDLINFSEKWVLTNSLKEYLNDQIELIDELLKQYFKKIKNNNFNFTYKPNFWWLFRLKIYNYLIKNKVLKAYIVEILDTRNKVSKFLRQ